MYSTYYQAYLKPETAWFVTALLKSFEHMMFDRTIDAQNSIYEFFVAPQLEGDFLEIMAYIQHQGYVSDVQKLPNRLANPDEKV